jgi:diguanylate cyclase (GGDEF)-like protein
MSQPLTAMHFHGSALLAAWAVGVYALYLQSLVVRRVRAHDRDTGFGWLLGGAVCVGSGIWAEGLLCLIAWQLPMPVGYVRAIVLASWLPAVVISAGAIWMQFQRQLPVHVRVLGGGLVASGLCLLTFINVSSIVVQPQIHWDLGMVAWAAAVFLGACTIGSVLIRRALGAPLQHAQAAGVSVLVATLFMVGQILLFAAAKVPAGAVCLSMDQLSGGSLEFVLPGTVSVLLFMAHLATLQDKRTQRKNELLSQSLQQAQDALQEASQHDPATGLLNRLGFEHALRQLLAQDTHGTHMAENPLHLSVLRLNLDGFKALVETYGHGMGDTVVRHLAARLRGLVRDDDVLSRADTDEYLLMCKGLPDEHTVAQLARRLQQVIHEPCLINDQDLTISSSIGVASYPASTSAEQLLSHSLDAMLTARKAGGGVYCLYERGMDRQGLAQIEMQRDLRHALARNELALHFQPKLRAHDNTLAGVEALLRWTHPLRGNVSPAEFIPVAERFGLIGELGLWVLDEACRHIRLWHEAGLNIPVAVNVSAHQLRQPDLELRVRDALKRHRVPARMLIMEITESAAMDDIEASLRVFDMLDAIGVRLSIDDFGTGYSSLSYLRRLPARQLKIDRSFVRDLASSLDAQAIVEAVVRLSHALGLKVVAEGVETQAQAQILAQLQCDELQGFLFAKPMPESALLAWLVQRGTAVPQVQAAAPGPRSLALHDDEPDDWPDLEAALS